MIKVIVKIFTWDKMGKYTNIKSNFVKKKFMNADWEKDKGSIDELIFLERTIIVGIKSLRENVELTFLLINYQKEYNEIFKELDPKGFKKYIYQKNKEDKEEREEKEWQKREEEAEERMERDNWVRAKKMFRRGK